MASMRVGHAPLSPSPSRALQATQSHSPLYTKAKLWHQYRARAPSNFRGIKNGRLSPSWDAQLRTTLTRGQGGLAMGSVPAVSEVAFVALIIGALQLIFRAFRKPQLATVPDGSFSGDHASASAAREELFGRISPVYDVLNDVLSLGLHRMWKRKAIALTSIRKGEAALDVCCGSGDLARILSKRVGSTGKVTGLDFARPMLQYAASKTSKTGSGRAKITWLKGDAMQLPFGENQYDAVTVGYGLRNVASPAQCLRELHRVVKPGRKVSILDFNNSSNRFVRAFQFFCLQNIVVPVATLCGARAEYAYLRPSIERYPKGDELVRLALESGFKEAKFIPIAFGLMGILVAAKGEES